MEKSFSNCVDTMSDKLERVREQYKQSLNDSFNEIISKFNETMELYNNFDEREFICRLKCNWIKNSKEELRSATQKIDQNIGQCVEDSFNFLIEKNEQSNILRKEIDLYNDELYGVMENIKSNFDNVRSNFLKAANNMVDEMKNQANFHFEIDNHKDDKPKDLSERIKKLKEEVANFTKGTKSIKNTEAENNPVEFNSFYDSYSGNRDDDNNNDNNNNNDSLTYSKPREFNILDDSSNRRRDIYDNNNCSGISGQKRKHPIIEANDDDSAYIASDMTKKLNNQSCDDSPTVTNSKNVNDSSHICPVLSTSNIANRSDTVDLLSDSD